MTRKMPARKRRTAAELARAYAIEKELSLRLRNADKEKRKKAYTAAYDEWNARVLNDPHLSPRNDIPCSATAVIDQKKMLLRFLKPGHTFLEVGPGDCTLAAEIAGYAHKVYAVDVSRRTADSSALPANVNFIISDGCSIPLSPGSIDLTYSNQLLEHLHPEDAYEQLCNIYEVLTPGGMYLCVTPNRLCGPHDISGYFDDVASGFHIKEYTVTEAVKIFKKAGFSKCRLLLGAKGFYLLFPTLPVRWIESVLDKLPHALSRKISSSLPFKLLLGIKLVARK